MHNRESQFPRIPPDRPVHRTWSAGIFATLDIGRFPSIVAQADQARARLSQAKEAERGLADAIALEVVRARLQWEEAAGKYAALGRETAELEENDRVVRERFHQGVAISSEAQDARVSAVRARLRETATLCDLFIAQAAMEKAMGE
jgi:outer membrane protein TolC